MIYQLMTDGKDVGLAAYLVYEEKWLTDPRGSILYRNLDVLKSALKYAGYIDPREYIIGVRAKEDVVVELSKCRRTDYGYIFYKGDDKYYITEDRTRRLCSVGYATFPVDSYKKNLATIFNACMKMNLRKCKWTFDKRVLRFKLSSNTGAINICTITTLVDINKKRRESQDKVIPFNKDKKNNSLVIFTDKDIYDKRYVEEELATKLLDIIAAVSNGNENIAYESHEFTSTIFISD